MTEFSERDHDRIIEMAWEDRTPFEAIDFQFGGFYKPFVKDKCVGCGLCVEVCPHPFKAIQISPQSTTVIS